MLLSKTKASTTGRQTYRNIDRAEPCFITNRLSYTLERAHWVNAVRKDSDLKANVEKRLRDLGIVHDLFNLNDTTNLANLDRMLHVSLDKYGLFAVTASLATLRAIIPLVEEENRIWQESFDEGMLYIRRFKLTRSPFNDAQYELVVLHPEHFLPKGSTLTHHTLVNDQLHGKNYVVGYDRTLREAPGTADSPRYPAFTHVKRSLFSLNVFLVILNAEIKFRRYRRMGTMPRLSEDVEKLMDETIKLVQLIYWLPEKRSSYRKRADLFFCHMDVDVEDTTDIEMGMRVTDEEDDDTLGKSSKRIQGARPVKRRGENATLEQRVEYNQYFLSGRDFELNADDEEFLEELGYHLDSSAKPVVPGSDTDTLDPFHVATKVAQWLEVK